MVAFPAFKLGAIFLKQISKPLANAVKARAKNSPFFRTHICMPPAQFYHWCDVKLKMWTMNLGKPISVAPLNEVMAIELGAELLGEGIIFLVASSVLTFEFIRQSRKEAAKEADRKEELARIQTELKDLYFAKAKQETQIRELVRALRYTMPQLHYVDPTNFDTHDIPEHHRIDTKVDEGTSIFTKMNNLLWSAVDFVVPPVQDAGKSSPGDSHTRQIIIKVAEDDNCVSSSQSQLITKTTPLSPSPLRNNPSILAPPLPGQPGERDRK